MREVPDDTIPQAEVTTPIFLTAVFAGVEERGREE